MTGLESRGELSGWSRSDSVAVREALGTKPQRIWGSWFRWAHGMESQESTLSRGYFKTGRLLSSGHD